MAITIIGLRWAGAAYNIAAGLALWPIGKVIVADRAGAVRISASALRPIAPRKRWNCSGAARESRAAFSTTVAVLAAGRRRHLCTSAKGPSQNSKRFELLKGVELPQSNTEPSEGNVTEQAAGKWCKSPKIVQYLSSRCEPVGSRVDRRTGTPASSDFCNLTDRLPWLAP